MRFYTDNARTGTTFSVTVLLPCHFHRYRRFQCRLHRYRTLQCRLTLSSHASVPLDAVTAQPHRSDHGALRLLGWLERSEALEWEKRLEAFGWRDVLRLQGGGVSLLLPGCWERHCPTGWWKQGKAHGRNWIALLPRVYRSQLSACLILAALATFRRIRTRRGFLRLHFLLAECVLGVVRIIFQLLVALSAEASSRVQTVGETGLNFPPLLLWELFVRSALLFLSFSMKLRASSKCFEDGGLGTSDLVCFESSLRAG
jgi:hypothetical protein